jgi:transposase
MIPSMSALGMRSFAMMGRQDEPEQLFYAFRLESHVPPDHLLRGVDAAFDFGEFRRSLAPYYSATGRPSVDPELMLRMLLVGYLFGVRSERRLCEEVHLNLAYRWFCRLGLEGTVPDHSTFSKNRHGRFRESGIFRLVFEAAVRACLKAGLVRGETFAVDASLIEANASRNHRVDGKLTEFPAEEEATRPVREYLEALDQAAAEEAAKSAGNTPSGDIPPGNPPVEPKYTSLTDPAAAWTNKGQMKALFAYATNYLIDTEYAVIIDVEATPARWSAEVQSAKTMLTRTQENLGMVPHTLAADAAYGSGLMLGWLMGRGVEPHIPILDHAHQTNGFFTRADFKFDPVANVFICPAGKQLVNKGLVRDDGTMPYHASTKDCRDCALKASCTKSERRVVTRNFYEAEREHVRALKGTPAFERSARLRKKIEMRFAHLKVNLSFRRLRLRGLTGARDEFLLAATAQNLRKLVRFLACGPPPATPCAA